MGGDPKIKSINCPSLGLRHLVCELLLTPLNSSLILALIVKTASPCAKSTLSGLIL